MPTIYDVAKKAGVGIGTVSRALNDSPNISPETKERVLRVAREMGYQPHALARGLAKRRTGAVGAIVPFFTNYFYLELLKGIQHEVNHSKFDLILYSADDVARGEELLERVLRERRVDGVLYISMPISNRMARKIRSRRLPVVLVDSYHPEVDSIHVENQLGAYEATRYLLDLGYRRLGMINGKLRSFPARERRQGFLKALSDFGIEPRMDWLVECDDIDGQDGFNAPAGYRAMARLLDADDRPEALFVASDVQAYGVLRAARERGIRVPDDLALVAFDDIQPSELIGLTTVRQPMFEMGQRAVKRLAQKLDTETEDIWHEALGTRLVVRTTCGATRSSG